MRLGEQITEGTRALVEIEVAEDTDTGRPQSPRGLRTVRIGAGAGTAVHIEDGPVHRGARTGEPGPLQGRVQGVCMAGDAQAHAEAGARRARRGADQMRHAASIQMSARDSSRLIRGRQPSRSRAVRTSACCQLPQPSG